MEPRDGMFVKRYKFLSFFENMDKRIGKHWSSKYIQKLLDHISGKYIQKRHDRTTKSAIDPLQTVLK